MNDDKTVIDSINPPQFQKLFSAFSKKINVDYYKKQDNSIGLEKNGKTVLITLVNPIRIKNRIVRFNVERIKGSWKHADYTLEEIESMLNDIVAFFE